MPSRRPIAAAVLLLSLALRAAPAQDPAPAFEVASIKRNPAGPNAGNGFHPGPGGLRVTNCTLKQLIQAAFHVKSGTLFGLASWMEDERFDIDAKTPARSDFDQELRMLATLLTDRFQLRVHREIRDLKTQVLVLSKNGPKFRPTPDQAQKENITIRPTEISGTAIPFGHFVTVLEAQLDYPLTNETGLTGQFDLSLKYVRDDSEGPSVYSALDDQLGLKLETRKTPTQVLIIDNATRPIEN